MAGITLANAEAQLAAWLAASSAVALSQSYQIEVEGNRRMLTRADASEIREQIKFWQGQVLARNRVATGRSRTRYVRN